MRQTFVVNALEDWDSCLDVLVPLLRTGSILALAGPLGAGKTTFVQRLVRRLGSEIAVKSPTFALLRTYRLAHPEVRRLLHIDAYRLESEAEARVLNLEEELAEPGTVAAIEWPERLEGWLAGRGLDVVHVDICQDANGAREAILWT